MNTPKVRDESSVTTRKRRRQSVETDNSVGRRILECLGDNDYAWLSARTGVPATTISDCVKRGISRADTALKLADGLEVTVDWLLREVGPKDRTLTGASPVIHLTDVNDADWIAVPEYDLRAIDDVGKGDVISIVNMRRDWLYLMLSETKNLWIAKTLSTGALPGLPAGAPIICKDHPQGVAPDDGRFYLFRVNGGIVLAKFSYRGISPQSGEQIVTPRDLDAGDNQHFIVARVLGALARPL